MRLIYKNVVCKRNIIHSVSYVDGFIFSKNSLVNTEAKGSLEKSLFFEPFFKKQILILGDYPYL